jgi:hypothetical protein
MNQPDSFEEKLMRKRGHSFDDSDTSLTESEHDSIKMPIDRIRFDEDNNDDTDHDGNDDFWL